MLKKLQHLRDLFLRLRHLDRYIDDIKMNQGRSLAWMQRAATQGPLWQHEFKVFSQWGEDGIIQYLVNNLAIKNRTFIEFGVEDFSESNCRFLMMKDQWHGYVIDGSPTNIKRLRASYYFWQSPLNCKASFITRENVEALLDESGFEQELGILSVDIDGVDYHVLEALASWRPAILIVEYNDAFGWERPVSVPYDPAFVRRQKHFSSQYWGANLPAFLYLADQRGYALVGTNSVGSNAFFVRRELLNDCVSEVDLASCIRQASFRDSRGEGGELTFLSGLERTRAMAEMPLVDVATRASLRVGDTLV
nr:hypothetical protein [uncultured bacterium]